MQSVRRLQAFTLMLSVYFYRQILREWFFDHLSTCQISMDIWNYTSQVFKPTVAACLDNW
ncbi:unnamed protein product, partial [Musa textilis]